LIKIASEQCEDNNIVSNDGCSSTCKLEAGWTCTGVFPYSTNCVPNCMDGLVVGDETCDDGVNDGTGCGLDCKSIVLGWSCSLGNRTTASICVVDCGNGVIDPGEDCDDGATPPVDGDGCSGICRWEPGWTCTGTINPSCTPICGDNYRVTGETCDDGDKTDGNGCKSDCSGTLDSWTCTGGTATTKDTCVTACKDTFLRGSE
jgi:cysteine-rich repeat protein